MAAAVENQTREQKIACYAALEALSSVLTSTIDSMERWLPDGISTSSQIDVGDGKTSGTELFNELWPDDDGEVFDGPEYVGASARSAEIAADICAYLAGPFGQEFLVSEAMRQMALSTRFAIEAKQADGH